MENEVRIQSLEQFNELRKRVLAGDQVSRDEVRAGIEWLKQDRVAAQAKGASKKAAAGGRQPADLDQLFGELGLGEEKVQ